MIGFERLIEEHDRLSALAAALVRAVDGAARDVDHVLGLRTDLATELAAHLHNEDGYIYPRLIAGSDHATAHTARRFIETFERLAIDWADYLESWTRDAIAADWPLFGRETHAIMARLQRRIEDENALLYPLALRAGAIRLRAHGTA